MLFEMLDNFRGHLGEDLVMVIDIIFDSEQHFFRKQQAEHRLALFLRRSDFLKGLFLIRRLKTRVLIHAFDLRFDFFLAGSQANAMRLPPDEVLFDVNRACCIQFLKQPLKHALWKRGRQFLTQFFFRDA